MSSRPQKDKQIARLRKALRNTPPVSIDLIQWLVDHKKVSRRRAKEMILEGKVMVDSHKVGRVEVEVLGRKEWVLAPYLPAYHRRDIVVVD